MGHLLGLPKRPHFQEDSTLWKTVISFFHAEIS
jgi:hypothetical protein